ncbi:MAG: organic hydroperoxide resistance protein [Symbiopectobacterium sp.]|uniref:organic hydroperoxide resistance protein n=1 Tax=Symbiopectobacterium sp. TaxID=2952789 RepID=UPI0039EB7635
MKIEKAIYVAQAKATSGHGAHVSAIGGDLNIKLDTPKAMGGTGTNPEQLFAAGYSACFLAALAFVANSEKITIPPEATIEAHVGIGKIPNGFGLEAELKIALPGMESTQAKALIEKAHILCLFSNATRNNVEVTLTLL